MNENDATEWAYKNGYEKGFAAGYHKAMFQKEKELETVGLRCTINGVEVFICKDCLMRAAEYFQQEEAKKCSLCGSPVGCANGGSHENS